MPDPGSWFLAPILNFSPERLMLAMFAPCLRYRFQLAIGRVAPEFFKVALYLFHLFNA